MRCWWWPPPHWPPLLLLFHCFCCWLCAQLADGGGSDFWHRDPNRTYKPRRYWLTLSIRNHNVSDVQFFRLVGVDNTVDFHVLPGQIFTNSYQVNRKGAWTLFVEFPGDRYAKSPRKLISRDSFPHWVMEVYSFPPDSVGFSEWHKMRRPKPTKKRGRRKNRRRRRH